MQDKHTNFISTVSVFTFTENKFWAFKQMRLSLEPLSKVEGLMFYKVLGCGAGNGFSIFPDLGTYVLLLHWKSSLYAEEFFRNHELAAAYREKASGRQQLFLEPTGGHGAWDGTNPFLPYGQPDNTGKIMVLTRATIHTGRLLNFWKYVPRVSKSMEGAPGLRFALGIGELPLVQQATISLWDSLEDVKNYAYTMRQHKEVVKQTRKQGWYKEELFVRFRPVSSVGTIPELSL